MATVLPSMPARSTSSAASPSTASRAANCRVANATQMSGPKPAGSPELTTMTGSDLLTCCRLGAAAGAEARRALTTDIDERLVAQAARPQLALFLGLPPAD